jgi:hypothetical protein
MTTTTYKTSLTRSPAAGIAGKDTGNDCISQLSPRASSQHVEVMERLKQLMAWQEKQKASLLRQQQEQIMQLQEKRIGKLSYLGVGLVYKVCTLYSGVMSVL